ncbi:MAG: SRPBCC domain-containing protein [Chloroflexota bacterium]
MSNRNVVAEPNQHSIVATAVFNAPRDLVFKVMNDPELITEWWAPRGCTTTVEKMDFRTGGGWRYIVEDTKGNNWTFHGIYHTIEEPVRTITTSEYEDSAGQVSLETVAFEDHESGTKVTTISVFQSIESRDGMIESGMTEDGWIDRFSELLEKIQAGD